MQKPYKMTVRLTNGWEYPLDCYGSEKPAVMRNILITRVYAEIKKEGIEAVVKEVEIETEK